MRGTPRRSARSGHAARRCDAATVAGIEKEVQTYFESCRENSLRVVWTTFEDADTFADTRRTSSGRHPDGIRTARRWAAPIR
jgi:hypothetical protein